MVNKKNNQRARNTHKKIQDAYLQLVSDNPDKRVKVIDLCSLAKINRATFYAHFYDVDEVATSLQTEIMSNLVSILNDKKSSSLDVRPLLTSYFGLVKSNQTFFYHFFIRINAPGSLNVLKSPEIAELAMAAGNHQVSEESLQYRLDFFNGGILAITKRWLKNDCRTPISELINFVEEKIKG